MILRCATKYYEAPKAENRSEGLHRKPLGSEDVSNNCRLSSRQAKHPKAGDLFSSDGTQQRSLNPNGHKSQAMKL